MQLINWRSIFTLRLDIQFHIGFGVTDAQIVELSLLQIELIGNGAAAELGCSAIGSHKQIGVTDFGEAAYVFELQCAISLHHIYVNIVFAVDNQLGIKTVKEH